MDLSFGELLREWWAGTLDPHARMIFPIYWWERFGKLLSFVGGMTVILDIVGPEKVRAAGIRLRNFITMTEALKAMFYSILYLLKRIGLLQRAVPLLRSIPSRRGFGRLPDELRPRIEGFLATVLDNREEMKKRLGVIEEESYSMTVSFVIMLSLLALVLSVGYTVEHWDGMYFLMYYMIAVAAYIFLAVFLLGPVLDVVVPAATSMALVLSSLLAVGIDVVIDEVADVLDHRENDVLLRLAGMSLFLIGFCLDMLGS